MSTITADPNMKSVLSQATGVTEIRDANGNLMGIYTPTVSEESLLVEKAKSVVNREELERRKREESGKGITTEELVRRLDSVGTPK